MQSAAANPLSTKQIQPENLIIQDIRVDAGPIIQYYKPGAMGRANPQRKRMSHIQVVLAERDVKRAKVTV